MEKRQAHFVPLLDYGAEVPERQRYRVAPEVDGEIAKRTFGHVGPYEPLMSAAHATSRVRRSFARAPTLPDRAVWDGYQSTPRIYSILLGHVCTPILSPPSAAQLPLGWFSSGPEYPCLRLSGHPRRAGGDPDWELQSEIRRHAFAPQRNGAYRRDRDFGTGHSSPNGLVGLFGDSPCVLNSTMWPGTQEAIMPTAEECRANSENCIRLGKGLNISVQLATILFAMSRSWTGLAG
jgi:hypothetical protein